ncbi:uncharacterized protein LOC143051336 [Mytilus galloprovincialis]|uniref:uncharacterized protein LOC143051336 n=1 Tax=Mytilus galloprovincialis TaxID=29158 RepID=UPI003F7BF32F
MRETCISIKGSNQIGEYSYGQIRCIEDKSVNVQQIWFDNEGNCEYETSKRKEIFNERLAITCESFSLCKVPFYRSNVNRNYTYLNLRFHCAESKPIHRSTTVNITCPANNVIVIDAIWDDSSNCPAYRYPPQKMTNTTKTLYDLCNESPNCLVTYSSPIDIVTSIFYHCKAGSNISRNKSSNHVITTATDSNMRNTSGG